MFLSPGEKLRQIREELDVTQEQFSFEKLSRRSISNIEIGKKIMNPYTANIIVERVHDLKRQLKISTEKNITTEYLLEDIDAQARKEIKKIINALSKQNNEVQIKEKIKRAENIIRCFKVDETLVIELNNSAKEHYIKVYNLSEALKYILNNLKIYLFKKDEYNALLMKEDLIKVYYLMGYYDNVAIEAQDIEMNYNIKCISQYKNICYNAALAYYYLRKYDISLNWLEKINENEINKCRQLQILELKANILSKKKRYEEAEEIYYFIVKEASENSLYELKSNNYSNIADVYREKNNKEKAFEYINKALKVKATNYRTIMNVNYNAFLIAVKYMDNNNLHKYFEQALKYATFLKKIDIQLKLFTNYLIYCINGKLNSKVEYIMSLINSDKYIKLDEGVLSMTAEAYLDNKDSEVLKNGLNHLKISGNYENNIFE